MNTDIELINYAAALLDAHESMTGTAEKLRALAARMPRWIPVAEKPDADTTVLLFDAQANEPAWPGYLDGNIWRYADGMITNPTHWADMPGGPA